MDLELYLNMRFFRRGDKSKREKRQASNGSVASPHWYAETVANSERYITAAFRSSRSNEAYIFMNNEYVVLDYGPSSTIDRVLNGPLLISDGFPSLAGTAFANYGINCAFGCHDNDEAFIFCGNLCARINYAPAGTKDDKIIKGPMTIAAMFPFFKGTVFESSVDAAFESSRKYEAYLFKGDNYALINYNDSHLIGAVRLIKEGFPCLKSTIFASGVDVSFAMHRTNEAYLFKGDSYARINFAPGTTDDYIVGGGVKLILPNWPALSTIILARKNQSYTKPA